jgi:nucleotide-binding universal stress UspA family protein
MGVCGGYGTLMTFDDSRTTFTTDAKLARKEECPMAYPFRAILSPIQFDDPSLLNLGLAKRIAQDSGATLHLLHVIPILPEPEVNPSTHSREEHKEIGELKRIADRHLTDIKCELHTRFAALGALAKEINQVAVEVNADLIVLKTHGRHGLSHLLLGSVAEEVVRSAPCSVLTLTPNAQQKAAHLRMERLDGVVG